MTTKILLIYTGGTIGMVKDYETQSLRPFNFENLKERIPELELVEATISYLSFEKPIDSSDMTPEHWKKLAYIIKDNYNDYDGFVVLHGTDTMAYTASAISFMFEGLSKPIIFTGSQLPIGDLRTDAKENLLSSIHYASLTENKKPIVKEVCLYFEYKLYRANRTSKNNAEQFEAFHSPNYPILGESGVHVNINKEYLLKETQESVSLNTNFSKEIGLLKVFPGINMPFIECVLNNPAIKVLILEVFGAGNIFNDDKFNKTLIQRVREGLHIVVITQCQGGTVELGRYHASDIFIKAKAVSGGDMTTEAAVTKAMYILGQPILYPNFKKSFEKNLKGERSN